MIHVSNGLLYIKTYIFFTFKVFSWQVKSLSLSITLTKAYYDFKSKSRKQKGQNLEALTIDVTNGVVFLLKSSMT